MNQDICVTDLLDQLTWVSHIVIDYTRVMYDQQ